MSLRSAICSGGLHLPTRFGADGVRGRSPTFEEHVATAAGQAEVRAWQKRVAAAAEAKLRAVPKDAVPGVLDAGYHTDAPNNASSNVSAKVVSSDRRGVTKHLQS